MKKGNFFKLFCQFKGLSYISSMLMLDTRSKFECLKHSHGSYSEHTGFPNAGALPGATFLSGREAAAVLIGCARLPLGKLFSGA